jgi:hypothetical protein
MRIAGIIFVLTLGLGQALVAQQEWEIGGVGGAGFLNGLTVSNGGGTATTGFKTGAAFGALVGHNLYPKLGGEIRYTFQMSDLKLSSGGTEVTFKGVAHVVHYDVLYHPARRRSRTQPFVAVGAGVKLYRGTGKQAAYQPLNQFAYLTHTSDLRPLISAGGGIKYRINEHTVFRAEVRDYITPFPNKVIAPAPGAKVGGWLQDFVPMFGVSWTF